MSRLLTSDSELRAQLAAATFKNIKKYKILAEWLGVYQYINPGDRQLLQIEVCIDDTGYAFAIWEWLCCVECCLTLDEQYRSWKLIKES